MNKYLFIFYFLSLPLRAESGEFSPQGLFIQVFNFSIFFVALFFLTRKPLSAFFHKRQKDFMSFLEMAKSQEKEKQKEHKEWDDKIKALQKKAQNIQQQAQKEGEIYLSQKQAQLKLLKQELKKSADFLIYLETQKAKKKLIQKYKAKLILSAKEELKKESLSFKFQEVVLENFLTDIEERLKKQS